VQQVAEAIDQLGIEETIDVIDMSDNWVANGWQRGP